METFTESVIAIIKHIPPGNVMTYGQISNLAGRPRGARQVARILHSMSEKYQLPWHRVINAKGKISFKDDEMFYTQKTFLEREGVNVVNENKIDLELYQYTGLK
ncbi:DNA methyltransferase [Aquibacillus halophilus]|uniref:DNA methyltransferase n=1 Tax=Aquibacillus halophilus TaxID=930132 RepID=A0A6A8DHL7_9BACI|nr:DNA methyltransferase [Aquibacillus halophilus]